MITLYLQKKLKYRSLPFSLAQHNGHISDGHLTEKIKTRLWLWRLRPHLKRPQDAGQAELDLLVGESHADACKKQKF